MSESDIVRVRVLQTDPLLGDVEGNLAHLDHQVRIAAPDTDLVVAPELATHGYHLSEVPDALPLAPDDERLIALGRYGPSVVVGFAEAFRHHTFNSAALLDDSGSRVQRKMYLPTYRGWEERKHFRPGGRLHCYEVGPTVISTLICNDAWQPAVPWLAAHGGAEVLVVPANSARTEIGVLTSKAWDSLLVHAAVVLQSYVIFVNRSGREGGRDFWGGSRVYAPDGSIIAQCGEAPETIDCELDLVGLRRLRRQWPLLQEARADVIARSAQALAEEEY